MKPHSRLTLYEDTINLRDMLPLFPLRFFSARGINLMLWFYTFWRKKRKN